MAVQQERPKVLDMLASQRISVDQAGDLLRALTAEPPGALDVPIPPRMGVAWLLRISIDAHGGQPGRQRRRGSRSPRTSTPRRRCAPVARQEAGEIRP
jgi:hypothetical protein